MPSRLLRQPGVGLPAALRRSQLVNYGLPTQNSDGVTLASSARAKVTPVTHASVAHSSGAWVEVVASLTNDCDVLTIAVVLQTAVNTVVNSCLLDVGIGGSGSEVVVVQGLMVGYKIRWPWMEVPLRIPAGSRVAVRLQGAELSKSVPVVVGFGSLANERRAPSAVTALGLDTANSKGVTLTAPGALNTKAAWTQIIASTADAYFALIVGVQGAASTAIPNASSLVDIAIGGAGSEIIVVPDIHIETNTNEATDIMGSSTFPVTIPAGSRLSARFARSVAGVTLDVALHGVRR